MKYGERIKPGKPIKPVRQVRQMEQKSTDTYLVTVREVWTQTYEVKARDKNDAIARVNDADGDTVEGTLEFSHLVPPDGCSCSGRWRAVLKECEACESYSMIHALVEGQYVIQRCDVCEVFATDKAAELAHEKKCPLGQPVRCSWSKP